MKKYCVTYRMTAKVEVYVDAENANEAHEKAEQFMCDADFGPAEDIEWEESYSDTDEDDEE